MGIKLRLNLQVKKVNKDTKVDLNVDCMFDSMSSMSFLNVGVTDIYQTIHTLNHPKTAKACFGVDIHNCLMILAFYHSWSSSNSHHY
jgi:hypothetical protein